MATIDIAKHITKETIRLYRFILIPPKKRLMIHSVNKLNHDKKLPYYTQDE